jgi:hypothetical protein
VVEVAQAMRLLVVQVDQVAGQAIETHPVVLRLLDKETQAAALLLAVAEQVVLEAEQVQPQHQEQLQ